MAYFPSSFFRKSICCLFSVPLYVGKKKSVVAFMYNDILAQNRNLDLWSFLSNVHVCCFTIYRVKKCRSESELGLIIFSFRYHIFAWKLVKISSLSLGYRNSTRMWSDLFLFSWILPATLWTFSIWKLVVQELFKTCSFITSSFPSILF